MLRGVHLVCLDDGDVTDALTALPCFLKLKPIQARDIRHFLSPPYLSGILIHEKKKLRGLQIIKSKIKALPFHITLI